MAAADLILSSVAAGFNSVHVAGVKVQPAAASTKQTYTFDGSMVFDGSSVNVFDDDADTSSDGGIITSIMAAPSPPCGNAEGPDGVTLDDFTVEFCAFGISGSAVGPSLEAYLYIDINNPQLALTYPNIIKVVRFGLNTPIPSPKAALITLKSEFFRQFGSWDFLYESDDQPDSRAIRQAMGRPQLPAVANGGSRGGDGGASIKQGEFAPAGAITVKSLSGDTLVLEVSNAYAWASSNGGGEGTFIQLLVSYGR